MTRSLEPDLLKPRAGYTLPVFACAAAIAALRKLHPDSPSLAAVPVNLLEPAETVEIPVEQVANLSTNSALAIARSDPGDNLDLTRNTPIWALVERLTAAEDVGQLETNQDNQNTIKIVLPPSSVQPTLTAETFILLKGGEGIGRQMNADNQPAIYAYARRLFQQNLALWLGDGEQIQVTIILPDGKALAQRTSNAAFGVVEGLSLLGTTGIAQPLSAPGQLEAYRDELQRKASDSDCLVFCVGENGLDLAQTMGIRSDRLIKTANWLGPLLVEAGIQGICKLLLFGYHGKLIKLAGGIFHTHHHVADGRQEIFAAHCANLGLPTAEVRSVFASATTEAALGHLRQLDAADGSRWVEQVYGAIARQIDQRSAAYIYAHSGQRVEVGSVLFDRDRKIVCQSEIAATILSLVC